MKMTCFVAALALCGCAGAGGQAPPPVQPGAPGQPSRTLSTLPAASAAKPPSEADIRFMQDMIMHHGQAVEMTELAKSRAQNKAVKDMAAKIDLSQGDEIRWMKQWLAERGIAPESMGGMEGMADHKTADKPLAVEPDGTPVTHLGHNNADNTAHTNSMPGMNHGGTDRNSTDRNSTDRNAKDPSGMDHSAMDHSAMDHGGMDHGGMDHSGMKGMDHAHPAAANTDPMDTAMMPGMLTPRQMNALRAAHGAEFDRLFLTGMMQHHRGALLMVKDLFQHPGAGEDPQLFDFANDVDNTQLAEIDIMKGILRKVNP